MGAASEESDWCKPKCSAFRMHTSGTARSTLYCNIENCPESWDAVAQLLWNDGLNFILTQSARKTI